MKRYTPENNIKSSRTKIIIDLNETRRQQIITDISDICKDLKRFFNTQPHINLIINGEKQQLCKISPTTITERHYRFKPTYIQITLHMCSKVTTTKKGGALAGKIMDVNYDGYDADKIRNKEFLDSLKGNWLNFMQEGVKKRRKYDMKRKEEEQTKNYFYFSDDSIKNKDALKKQLK